MSESPDDTPMPQLAAPEPPHPTTPAPSSGPEVKTYPAESAPARTSPVAWIALAVAVIEAGALAYAWTHPQAPAGLADQLSGIADQAHGASMKADEAASGVDAVKTQFASTQQAVAALQNRPEVTPFDPQPLQAAVASLRSDLDAVKGEAADAQKAAADAQKEADGAKDAVAAGVAAATASLSGRIDDLSSKLDALSTRLDQEGAQGRQVASLASSAERLARLQAASVALSIGRPIGDVPNAPPALARFADHAPPTEASLILGFPDAAAAALKASQPDTAGEGFFRRIWIRAQSAVTVRDGTHVLLGDPAAGIIAAARERLAAGDLDGAVSVLGALSGPAADAMDPWRSQAAALVDARAALATMMARR